MLHFNNLEYYDDRLFVLYLCKGTVEMSDMVTTTLYHNNAPDDHIWCVVTYRNTHRYPLYRVDSFHKKEDAEKYLRVIEPQTPLISLGGKSPTLPLPYDEYAAWKDMYKYNDYDWKKLYLHNGTRQAERILQAREQFMGIR
jgi:hypothetical protein